MGKRKNLLQTKSFVPACLFLIFILVPIWGYVTGHTFYVTFFARMMIYAVAAMALNLVLGYGGLISLGHALFFGLGAYSVAIPAYYGVDSGWFHLFITLLSCGFVGYITGLISLRTSGISFIMITLAFAQMGFFFFVSLRQYGGDEGTSISNTSTFSGVGLNLGDLYTVYISSLVVLLLVTWFMAKVRHAPFGMVLRGARQNIARTASIGYPATRYQLVAYVLSALICGLAGMLMANLNAFASPDSLSWIISGDLLVMVVLGGLGTVFGPLLGAFVFLGLEEVLKFFTSHWLAIFGLAIVAIGLFGKAGIAGYLEHLQGRTREARP